MGRMFAMEIAEFEGVDIEYKVGIQLQHNHFPPVSLDFVPACLEAIESVSTFKGDQRIELPNGKVLSAVEIVEGLHLDDFCYWEE